MDWIVAQPFWLAVVLLTGLVCFRAQVCFWIGRGGAEAVEKTTENKGGFRGKLNRALKGASVQRGVDAIDRWGLVIIPLSFCTWGFQTLVQVGAGVMRLPWHVYTLVAFPGYIIWAVIYATVGWALITTLEGAMSGATWAVFALTALVIALAALIVIRRLRRANSALESAN